MRNQRYINQRNIDVIDVFRDEYHLENFFFLALCRSQVLQGIFLASPFSFQYPARYSLTFFPFIRRNLKIDRFHLLSSRSTDGIVAEPIIRTAKRKSGLPASLPLPYPPIPFTFLSTYLPVTSVLHAQPTHSVASGLLDLPETCRRNRNERQITHLSRNSFPEKLKLHGL